MQRLTANSGPHPELTAGLDRTIVTRRLNRVDKPASVETECTLETTSTT